MSPSTSPLILTLIRLGRLLYTLLHTLLLSLGLLWLIGLWVYQPISLLPAALLLAAYLILWRRTRKRPTRTRLWLWGMIAIGIATYAALPGPQPDAWQTPWAKAPSFTLQGNNLTIYGVRDFRYRSAEDYDIHYLNETYDLSALTGADFAECHWDGHTAICHTMISFSFADGRHLVVSPETRLPEKEQQNAVAGLYKRYGLIYIFGTEEDLFALRTNYRHEDLILMPMRISPTAAKEMLLHFVRLQEQAETRHTSYNTITANCSSGIMDTFRQLAPTMPWSYRLAPIHNASISRILFRHQALQARPGESWEEFQQRCSLGYDLSPENRQAYPRTLRDKINTPYASPRNTP